MRLYLVDSWWRKIVSNSMKCLKLERTERWFWHVLRREIVGGKTGYENYERRRKEMEWEKEAVECG